MAELLLGQEDFSSSRWGSKVVPLLPEIQGKSISVGVSSMCWMMCESFLFQRLDSILNGFCVFFTKSCCWLPFWGRLTALLIIHRYLQILHVIICCSPYPAFRIKPKLLSKQGPGHWGFGLLPSFLPRDPLVQASQPTCWFSINLALLYFPASAMWLEPSSSTSSHNSYSAKLEFPQGRHLFLFIFISFYATLCHLLDCF